VPLVRIDGELERWTQVQVLTATDLEALATRLLSPQHQERLRTHLEVDVAWQAPGVGRCRASVFRQRGTVAVSMRLIPATVPSLQSLGLPSSVVTLADESRGLVLITGVTGSGKSTTLAAIVDLINRTRALHILTIEDPIEFVHEHRNCIITQREVGVDTEDWDIALKNSLRQAPDVILIGEVRARETMDYAISFAETGHLCLATLHANSTNQALDRIINFFPEDRRPQLLMDLSLNIRAFVAQRLIPRRDGKGRVPAVEVMLNSPLISDLVFKGDISGIKELMKKSRELGMQTFDQSLFGLYESGLITYEDALRNADSLNDLRLEIKLHGKEAKGRNVFSGIGNLDIVPTTVTGRP
jgi:twitching motility protein PilU